MIEHKKIGTMSRWSVRPDKHWCSVALTLAAGAIGYSGNDGWGWCLFIVFYIECI